MDELLSILGEVKPGVDFTKETKLVDDGILDSLDIITIIAEITDSFDVTVSADLITNENFNSAKSMMAMINTLLDD